MMTGYPALVNWERGKWNFVKLPSQLKMHVKWSEGNFKMCVIVILRQNKNLMNPLSTPVNETIAQNTKLSITCTNSQHERPPAFLAVKSPFRAAS
jgi:hypothetical protein